MRPISIYPAYGVSKIYGKYTLYPRAEKVSANASCFPLVAPKISEIKIITLFPYPA
jgi:hypothetical protein